MHRKVLMACMALVAFAAFAVAPAIASAAPSVDPSTGKFPLEFEGINSNTGPAILSIAGEFLPPTECPKVDNKGKFESGSTGKVEFTFTECHVKGSTTTCTSAGQLAGTITTGESEFHLIYLENTATLKKPGVLVTPPTGGVFAQYTCGSFTYKVEGNGIIGEITSPECGKSSTGFTDAFTTTNGSQTWTQVETAGTVYNLKDAGITAVESATGSSTFKGGASATLTCP